MSLESDAMFGVRKITDEIKRAYEKNLKTAVDREMITIESEKIPGLTQLMNDAVDQALVNGSDYLLNVLKHHSRQK